MSWTIEFDRDALRTLKKLDKSVASTIADYLDDVAALDDPRARGKGLTGHLAGLWRYRVGDYRILCDLHDQELVIVAVDLGHRSKIYI
ncbi:type II toxin-antitoxin system RelE/ParE family toxin [Cryobacterium sp. Y50]|uniref:type II toxin-antitoxin system RelE family toxin n=1 Tax=Cryobacterium sp. Y50 TaxID=2048286 RepID=UPI000CE2E532|nr:type II toxin-antitoxin system RelE/ParE family toxin [Cryobacterium sp. Y50]